MDVRSSVYAFSKSRTRDAPLTFLKDYRGYLQADAYPGYDPLYLSGKIMEVACNAVRIAALAVTLLPCPVAYAESTSPPRIAAAQLTQRKPTETLGEVTIQALRKHHALRGTVDHFVFSTLVWTGHQFYPRWKRPVCPAVAGLSKADGDLILARISQVARAAGAPLAGRHCRANLFVMATSRPHLLLRLWWKGGRTCTTSATASHQCTGSSHPGEPCTSGIT